MHRTPTKANGTSATLGRTASGCGSKGQLIARKMHVLNEEEKEPANGISNTNAVGPLGACTAPTRVPSAVPLELGSTVERRQRRLADAAPDLALQRIPSAEQRTGKSRLLQGVVWRVVIAHVVALRASCSERDGICTIASRIVASNAAPFGLASAA